MKFYNEPYTISELLEYIYSSVCILGHYVIRIPCDQVHLDDFSILKLTKHLQGTCEDWSVQDGWYFITFEPGGHDYVITFEQHHFYTSSVVRSVTEWLHVDESSIDLECHLRFTNESRDDFS
ncbi:hypothetical protein ACU1JV_20805 [Paenibacillus sp. T2-29]|uniref:hypothetical protein n=1 Tax=Paenibacillus TaxID=44249 RepID=UPI00046EAD1B|nr:hypothetical protein [Paenibacillus polymyxa]